MISILAALLLASVPGAEAQDLKMFRAYESASLPSTVQLMVDEDIDLDHPLGRVLHVTVSEGEMRSRIHCDRLIALDAPRLPRQSSVETCSGVRILLNRPEALRTEKKVTGSWLDASGALLGSVEFELKYTQSGVHEGGRDD